MTTKTSIRLKLPEKKFLRLDECANRFGCSLDDMLNYLDSRFILACANLENLPPATWFKGFESLEKKEKFLASLPLSEQLKLMEDCDDKFTNLNEWERKGEIPARGKYLLLDVTVHDRQCTFQSIAQWWHCCDKVHTHLPYIDKQGHGVDFCSFSNPIAISANELFICSEQVAEFERVHCVVDDGVDNQIFDSNSGTGEQFVNLMDNKLELSEEPYITALRLSHEAGRLGVEVPTSLSTESGDTFTVGPIQKIRYTTEYINIMEAAISKFFEPRRNVDARREEVVPWIKSLMCEKGLVDSNNIASAMFTIIKPPDHDPRKRRG